MNSSLRFVVGIDPGRFGGVVALDIQHPQAFLFCVSIPRTVHTFRRLLDTWVGPHETLIFVEDETSSPGSSPASAFTFGMEFQRCLDAAGGYETVMVRPIEWQCKMGCRTRGDKNVTLRAARNLFPGHESILTNETADAALIAAYGLERVEMAKNRLGKPEISVVDFRTFEVQSKKRD